MWNSADTRSVNSDQGGEPVAISITVQLRTGHEMKTEDETQKLDNLKERERHIPNAPDVGMAAMLQLLDDLWSHEQRRALAAVGNGIDTRTSTGTGERRNACRCNAP